MPNTITATTHFFDTYEGHTVNKYSLTNANGVTVSAISMGATLYEILVPTKDGGTANLVLNYPNSADYLANPFYVSMAIGRTAGRIKNSELLLNNETYKIQPNEGNNNLHGGPHGFNTHVWDGSIGENNGVPTIIFHRVQKSAEDGFPSDLDVTITYQLTEDNIVNLSFKATALSADTVFNPTYHTYFNLGDDATILNQELQVDADTHLAFDDEKIPTGELIEVTDTPFDFRKPTRLGDAITAMQNTAEKGFDDIFKINASAHGRQIATLSDPATGRRVIVDSDRNGLVVFTANSFTKENMNFIKTNGTGQPYEGVALEAQTLPDATRFTEFGPADVILTKGETKTATIDYRIEF